LAPELSAVAVVSSSCAAAAGGEGRLSHRAENTFDIFPRRDGGSLGISLRFKQSLRLENELLVEIQHPPDGQHRRAHAAAPKSEVSSETHVDLTHVRDVLGHEPARGDPHLGVQRPELESAVDVCRVELRLEDREEIRALHRL
jgi:hypothetical protein